jgi:RHS repeat-associated protein
MAEGGEERAVFIGLKNDAQDALPKVAEHIGGFHGGTANELDRQLDAHITTDLESGRNLDQLGQRPAQSAPALGSPSVGSAAAARGGGYRTFSEQEVNAAGVESKGVDDVETGATDPVDLVSGQLLVAAGDVRLDGVLPLVLRRAYASGYRHGALFGPGWASTLDVRLLVQESGIRFLGDAAQTLDYGTPTGLRLGLPVQPEHGARWPLSLTSDGRYQVEDPASGVCWLFPRDGEGGVRLLAQIDDRNGNRMSVLRDERGVPVEVAHSGGYRVAVDSVETPAGARVSGLRLLWGADPAQSLQLLSYGYDQVGRLAQITDSSGVPYAYQWDEHDRICGWVDRNGHDYVYAYDAEGRVVRTRGAGGYLNAEIAYEPMRRVTAVTDGRGHTSAYHYDRFQQVTRIVDPLGGEVALGRDRYGRVLSATDQLGNTARAERDYAGRPTLLEGADGARTQIEYNALGLPVRIREPNAAIWQYAYDPAGNLLRATDPLGAITTYGYNERGALAAMTDPAGGTTTVTVNAAGLPVSASDPSGAVWRVERDVLGRAVAITDPLGAARRSGYGVEGQVLWRQDAAGAVERYGYDAAGNLIEHTDSVGAVTRFGYGPMGLRTSVTDPLGRRHGFGYDSELRLTRVTGPSGLAWTYSYDPARRLIGERDFDGRELSYRHDAAGRLIERVNGAGQAVTFEHDSAGRVIRRIAEAGEYRYQFDATGAMMRAEGPGSVLEFTRDLRGRALSESVDGRTLTRAYDALGRVTRRVTPSGALSQWTFDAAGHAQALESAGGRLEFAYDPAGRETARTLGPEVVLDRIHDPAGRLSALRLSARRELLQERTYAYRADGAVEHVADRLGAGRTYGLDPLGRATAVSAEGWSERYAYDELGNLAAAGAAHTDADAQPAPPEPRTVTGTRTRQDGRTTYEYDAEGRLVRKRRRTLSGQLMQWSYTWDALDRLVRVDTPDRGSWTYSYDPLGRRTGKTLLDVDGSARERTVFTYDGPRLVEETHSDPRYGAQSTTTWDYEPDTFVPVTQTRRRAPTEPSAQDVDAQFHAIVTDLVGTPRELVSPDGALIPLATRDLWGRTTASTDTAEACPLRFPGQYFDAETGLHYNLHRFYDPELAGYLSPDPLGLLPGPNPRAYIGNPLTGSDPLGLNGETGAGTPVPPPNASNSTRVQYGEDPMSRLAITARKQFGWERSGRNVAVYMFHDEQGTAGAIAIQSDGVHSERLGWDVISKQHGIRADQIDAIYTELQPCGPDYHNCDRWLAQNFPGVPVTHSFDYGPDKAGRTAGINSLKRALTQVRNGSLPK